MVKQLINKSVRFMVQRGVIVNSPQQREIHSYGLELIIYDIINSTVLLFIAFLFGRIFEIGAFLILFGFLQSNGGGYHADSHKKCLIVMVVSVIFFFIISSYYEYFVIQLISIICGWSTVFFLAPVAHRNHPLSPALSKKMGSRAKIIASSFTLIWCLCTINDIFTNTARLISLVMAFTTVSMIAAIIKNKKVLVYKD